MRLGAATRKYRWWAAGAVLFAAWAAWASYLASGGYPRTPFLPDASGPAATQATPIAGLPALPQMGLYQLSWDTISGLNARRVDTAAVVTNQTVLELVAVPTHGWHRLGVQFARVDPNIDYQVSAWVKPDPARFVMLEARDRGQGRWGKAFFDLVKRTAPAADGMARQARIESGQDGWLRLSFHMIYPDAVAFVYCSILSPAGDRHDFVGDGHQGILLGGIELTPHPGILEATSMARLPPANSSDGGRMEWDGILGLNAEDVPGRAVVRGAPLLRLVAVPMDSLHRIGERFTSLPRAGVYRVTALVKPESAAGVMLEARDREQKHYGIASYDLVHGVAESTEGDAHDARVEAGPDGWLRLSMDMRYEGGLAVVQIGLLDDALAASYIGDGHDSILFGGMELVSSD